MTAIRFLRSGAVRARTGMRAGRICGLLAVLLTGMAAAAGAQQAQSRFLASEDILLYGIGLRVEPAQQTVPKDIATIVSTFLQAPTDPGLNLPPFAPDAVVRATLRGPSFATPLELTARPNSPFNIPPLTVAGPHTLENIRLVSGGDVVLRGSPESVRIDVIDRLLVTQVTARPLTAAEIRERGIVFDATNFQAYNFTAAFAVQGGATINLNFPVVLPNLQGAQDVSVSVATIPTIQPPALQSIRSIIPDTLQIQTQVPNLSVVGFTLTLPELRGQNFIVPPIPGVIVFPGNIGFLNQFFSVLLMVSNAAPVGSNLSVSDLRASIVLPSGRDTVVGSGDDPLAMARTAQGETPRIQPVTQPGADGQLGTADDLTSIGPGETGNAEYLVEGRREGSHVVEMEIEGTLNGLPVGPVAIRGRAAGAVLVRNPTYTLTFIHPDTVSAGEPYSLDVSVTNTSESPANFVSVNLFSRNLSGATLVGDASKAIEFIAPGDSATVSFNLIARVTGKITAATLDSDAQVAGRFELKHAVGELGVPLSPESLVLPAQARSLPANLREATLGLLGKAWAVATAPAAALPRDVLRFSRQIVLDMAVAVAEAGLRVSLHEPLRDSATQLAMDFFGSAFARLPQRNPRPDDLEFARTNYVGFDDLRRRSIRGEVFAQAVADLLVGDFQAIGVSAFHRDVAEKISYRPDHLSALIGAGSGPLPYTLTLVDAQNRQVGGVDANGRIIKQIPFSDYLRMKNAGGVVTGQMAFLVTPSTGNYTLRLTPTPGVANGTPFTLSLVVPRADGALRQVVFEGMTGASAPVVPFAAADPYRVSIVIAGPPGPDTAPSIDVVLADPAPSPLGIVQQGFADQLGDGSMAGRVVAVLFSEEVTPESVQDKFRTEDITNYEPEANRVVSVALQPGGRVVFLALRDPLGPFIPRAMAMSGVTDLRGQVLTPQSLPMESTIPDDGGVVTGRVIDADGTPVPFANVRLFNLLEDGWVGISSKNTDEQGRYSWDFVLRPLLDRIVAVDPETNEFRDIQFNVQRNGQRLNVDIVLLGRGTFRGRTVDESGRTLANTNVRITSLTDQSQYGAVTDSTGTFEVARIPVGNLLVEAVNTTANAKTFISENIPFAGATTSRDIMLLSVEVTQVTVQHGNLRGHVLRSDSATPVSNVPVIVYYTSQSQPGVACPTPGECPVALVNTDEQGAFTFPGIIAGRLRIETFDQASFQRGEVVSLLAADATVDLNIILSAGLGTVRGVVLDPQGQGVAAARVGGGLSLSTTDATGRFTLTDVPVGRATIVAVSDALGSRGTANVDIARAGEEVNATIVLESVGGVGGIVRQVDGVTPAAGIRVYLFKTVEGAINVAGTAVTDAAGAYSMSRIPIGDYTVSAFRSDFSDGNIRPVSILFYNQIAKADVTFRGGAGRVVGTVFDDDGVTPLRARVSVSGDQLLIAGGQVGVSFQHVANFRIADTNLTTGAFALGGIWVGNFTLRAAGQFSPDPITLENAMPAAGATVQMDVRLQPTSQVAGQVFLPDGVTPAGANLIVRYKSNEFRVICSPGAGGEDTCTSIPQGIQEEIVVTDVAGRFGVPLVNAGTFTLTVEDPVSGRTGQIRGNVKAGERIDVSVRLVGLGDIAVRVRAGDGVTVIPGARVVVEQIDFPRKTVTALADSAGVLALSGGDSFSEGAFVVRATDVRNGFSGRGSGRIQRDGEQVSLDVFLYTQAGVVFGTLFRPDGATPVPFAEVVVAGPGGPLAFTLTDSLGAYRVDNVPLGAVTVDAFEAATARRAFAVGSVDADGQEVPINLRELAMGVVRGTVLEVGSLGPLKGWEVSLNSLTPGGRAVPSLRTTSSVDGTFSFPGVSQGNVSLSARRDGVNGSGNATGALQREGQAVEIPLLARITRPLMGTILGRVFDPTGQPAANSPIEICAGGCVSPAFAATLTASTDGTFTTGPLPLGRYQVRARAQASLNAGSAYTEILFDGETAGVTIVMVGLSQITGQVVRSDGTPAGNVGLKLEGSPSSGCAGPCVRFANADGSFTFVDVPARSFTVTATDPVSGFKGVAGDSLNPGETRTVRVVLEPTGSLRGRVLRQNLNPAAGVTVDLAIAGRHLFLQSDPDGVFFYETTPLGPFTIAFEDAVGTGVASAVGTVLGPIDLGDIRLDESPPAVGTVTPTPLATGVPLAQQIRLVFTERVQAGTITTANITLNDESGPVAGTLALGAGDTTVTFTPLSPLRESTRYSIRVTGVRDLLDKVLRPDFVSTFVAVDLTAPRHLDISPAPNTSGAPLYSPVRLKFSEPIDPTRTNGPPIALTGPGGAVDGRIDYLFGNTVAVFTPARPLAEDAVYQVHAPPASDLAGNVQAQALDYTFGTTDRTPPTIAGLSAPATVIENGRATVVAAVGTTHDVAFVDFFINDGLIATSRTAPFTLNLQAIPAFGQVGAQIRVSALATDTSGNRGTVPATASIAVIADAPPVVVITSPAAGVTAANGARVVVLVRSTDDLGVVQSGYKAQTGRPQDAAISTFTSPGTDRTESFGFNVPVDAAPGATILIEASASDTAGHIGQAAPVTITVLDAVAPVVRITGASTGDAVRPGQPTTVIVSADDLGGVGRVNFSTTGLVATTDSRTLAAAPPTALASFTFLVPASARPGDFITLRASAIDRAGNVGTAANVILPVVDTVPPTVRLRTSNGRLEMVPGRPLGLIADASDGISVSRVELVGAGAFTVNDARQVTPPAGDAQVAFAILVPDTLTAGSVLNLQARAYDLAGNVSSPSFLSLTVNVLPEVELPASTVVSAGQSADVVVSLPAGGPPAGQLVTFATGDPAIATAPPSTVFAAGETSRTISVTGQSGGTTHLSARIQGVERARMTVAVAGGIVDGVIFDPLLNPVAGASVTVSSFGVAVAATTTGDGRFSVAGVTGPSISVRALDPATSLRGFATATMNRANGFARVNVVLIPAGSIQGTVRLEDGQTPAGAGVRVDIYAANAIGTPLGTTFTGAVGEYEFPLVTLGSYTIDATAADGNRGRSSASVTSSGQDIVANVAYLGQGSVAGTVFNGSGQPVPNAELTFSSASIFGGGAVITRAANPDGSFQFDRIFVGTFQISARDPVTNRGASGSGTIYSHGQVVTQELRLATFGTVRGTVYRSDGTTTVPNASVSIFPFSTTTDLQGRYEFPILPLGSHTAVARDLPTRGVGHATGSLASQGQMAIIDVQLLGQGTVIATVTDASGQPLSGANVVVTASGGGYTDFQSAVTGTGGTAQIDQVLAGSFTTHANHGGLQGSLPARSLAAGEVARVTVTLEPTGRIAGSVFAPDGETPQTTGTAALFVYSSYYGLWIQHLSTPLGPAGSFDFDSLTLQREFQLRAFDGQGRLRALVRTPIALTAGGQVESRNLTFVGMGTVQGRVVNPDGSSAPGLAVQVRSLNVDFGGYRSATSDAAGYYEVQGLAVGPIAVNTGNASLGLLGEAFGQLAAHAQTLTLDVVLQGNAITLPSDLVDANSSRFDVQPGGGIGGGTNNVFWSNERGGSILEVVAGGTPTRFAGSAIGTVEDQRREIATRQQDVAGLNVTRKVFVPLDGYFARYLEVLSNPTLDPITVDLRVTSHVQGYPPSTSVIATSSGDATVSAADRWVTIDDADVDPSVTFNFPALAFAYDGAGAPEHVASAEFRSVSYCPYYCYQTGDLIYQWSQVVVPPGGTVAYLHFVAQHARRAGALAAAQRLDRLPPEALAGLSPDEIAAIRNFTVAPDGTSGVAPLSPIAGTVTGRLFEYDGATPSPSGVVYLRSNNPLFNRGHVLRADADGRFTLATSLNGSYGQVAIPTDGFSLYASHFTTGVVSPVATGTFLAGETTGTADVVFSNTGIVAGHVRRPGGGVATSGVVQLSGTGLVQVSYVYLSEDGSFRFAGVPGGAKTLTAYTSEPTGGTGLQATIGFTATAGQTMTTDVMLPATGGVTGIVSTGAGTPAVGAYVYFRNGNQSFWRNTYTDSSGRYTLSNIPEGVYQIEVTEPTTGIVTAITVTIVANVMVTQNLALVGIGTLSIQVNFANGTAASGVQVRVSIDGIDRYAPSSDANGRVSIANFPTRAFVVRAVHPLNTNASVSVSDTLTTHGAVLPVTVTLPGLSSVVGQVTYTGGAVAAAAPVRLYMGAGVIASATADASGNFQFSNLLLGQTYRVRALHPVQTLQFRDSINVQPSVDGDAHTANVTLPAQATVRVTVRRTDNSAFSGVRVQIADAFGANFIRGTTDAGGIVLAEGIPEGQFIAQALDANGASIGTASGTVTAANQGQTIDLQISTGVALPINLFDDNGYRFDLQRNGTLNDGTSDAFDGGLFLGVQVGAIGFGFGNVASGIPEDNNREIGITRAELGGLTVTRKVFVPSDGYFGRYLEKLTNPGTTPITVDVGVSSNLGSDGGTRIVATSSGDLAFSTADTWLVTDDDALATQTGDPTLAFVLGGPGAPRALSLASLPPSGSDGLIVRWNGIVVPPGQTVVLMHFVVQQPRKAGAIAAAQRLVQLPPEAIAGLSADERAQIVNWAVPADGSSLLAAIPRTGVVSGRALAGDGVTPATRATVTFATANASYPFVIPTTWKVTADANGQFSVPGVIVDDFTLVGTDAITLVTSPVVAGSFAAGETAATRDVVFSNTGLVRGVVTRGGVPQALVRVFRSSYFSDPVVLTAADGSFTLTGLLPGVQSVQAGNGTVFGSVTVTVVAGQSVNADIVIGAGAITGRATTASGAPVSVQVRLLNVDGSQYSRTYSDGTGTYRFDNLPLRSFTVQAVAEPNYGVPAPLPALSDGATVTVDVRLRAVATVRVRVLDVDGVRPIPNAQVLVDRGGSLGWGLQHRGYTDALGRLDVPTVFEPGFLVEVRDTLGLIGSVPGAIGVADNGTLIDVTIAAQSTGGWVMGTLFAADGATRIPWDENEQGMVQVELLDAVDQSVLAQGRVSSSYTLSAPMPAGHDFRVRATLLIGANPVVEATGRFAFRGENVRRDLVLPLAVISGVVRYSDGLPVPSPDARVLWTSGTRAGRTDYATRSGATGGYGVPALQLGDFVLTVQDFATGLTKSVAGSVTDPSAVVPIDITFDPTGTIRGTVVDAAGLPVQGWVGLRVAGAPSDRSTPSAADGSFVFNTVLAGPFHLQACDTQVPRWCGSVRGASQPPGETVATIAIPARGSVSGVVRRVDGSAFGGAEVWIAMPDYAGPLEGSFGNFVQADAAGVYLFNGVPPGMAVVRARDYANNIWGLAIGVVTAGAGTVVDVQLGTATNMLNLNATLDYNYVSGYDGTTNLRRNGGLDYSHQSLRLGAAGRAASVHVSSDWSINGIELSGRQLTIARGHEDRVGVRVTRKVFAPISGGFVRYIEELSNPLPVDVAVRVRIGGVSLLNRGSIVSSSSAQHVVVTHSGWATGFVFDGASGTPQTVAAASFLPGQYEYSYDWVVTVPAGQTIRLMHFLLYGGSAADLDPVVSSLGTPTGLALEGLTAAEIASIVNFVIPPSP